MSFNKNNLLDRIEQEGRVGRRQYKANKKNEREPFPIGEYGEKWIQHYLSTEDTICINLNEDYRINTESSDLVHLDKYINQTIYTQVKACFQNETHGEFNDIHLHKNYESGNDNFDYFVVLSFKYHSDIPTMTFDELVKWYHPDYIMVLSKKQVPIEMPTYIREDTPITFKVNPKRIMKSQVQCARDCITHKIYDFIKVYKTVDRNLHGSEIINMMENHG